MDLDTVFDDDRQPGVLTAPSLPASCAQLTTTPKGYLALSDLPESWREYFDERAAIREYDGGQAREHAEAEAWRETVSAMRTVGVADEYRFLP